MSEKIPSAAALQMLQDLLNTDDEKEKAASAVAFQVLLALLLTGDGSAATLVLQRHFATLLSLSDEHHMTELEAVVSAYGQFLTELEAVMNAYSILLSRLDVLAAATHHPEFLGLRRLIKQAVEERLERSGRPPGTVN
jgi:hypothetical protein